MKLCFLILMIMLAAVAQAAGAPQTNLPLTKDQVMDLVRFRMDSTELAKRIKERGIDFAPSEDYLEALRKAGAQEPVIQALREVNPKPLTRDQVGQLVAGGVPSERAVVLIKQHGIDFLADDTYLDTLRVAGADETLIAALREASKAVTAELAVETSPGAEVYLDGALQGKASAQGELVVRSKPGDHALKVSLAGRKDFEQRVTLVLRQPAKIEARLENPQLPAPGEVRENPRDGLKYVWIPPGTFTMGCSPADGECFDDEKPSHQVMITRGFWIGQTPVTVGAYLRFRGSGPNLPAAPSFNPGWANENMPIVNVTWDEARAYCDWAGGRLLTEAEWEYAARDGSAEVRYGNLNDIAWYTVNSGGGTHDVAQKLANGFGLYDMLGNVRQWVADWYDERYYPTSPSRDPSGPATGVERTLRGASWGGIERDGRVSDRLKSNPDVRSDRYGIRCGGDVFSP